MHRRYSSCRMACSSLIAAALITAALTAAAPGGAIRDNKIAAPAHAAFFMALSPAGPQRTTRELLLWRVRQLRRIVAADFELHRFVTGPLDRHVDGHGL